MYASIVEWIPASPQQVSRVTADGALLPDWHRLFHTASSGGCRLDAVGTSFDGRFGVGGRGVPMSWTVDRIVRGNLHLLGHDTGGRSARALISVSPWDGGSALQLDVSWERAGSRLPGPLSEAVARARLRRSARDLRWLVEGVQDIQSTARPSVRPMPVPATALGATA